MKAHYIIYVFIWMISTSLSAQLISVKAELGSDSIFIGDQVVFTLIAEMDNSVQAELPLLADSITDKIEILIPLASDTISNDGSRIISQSYLITSFEQGTHIIPVQKIAYATETFADSALTMPLLLNVYAPEVDTSLAIKPIKPPINTPITLAEILPWIAISYGGLLAITLIIALIWMYTQRDKDPEVFAALRQDPPHIVAFRELDKLKQEKIWEQGRIKEFYTGLTAAIRTYIERQYGIPAMESTTDEILLTFTKINTEDEILNEMLRDLLNLADLVKFAKEDPTPLENQSNLNNGYLFVQKTFPFFYHEELENENQKNRKEKSGKKSNEQDIEDELTENQNTEGEDKTDE